MGCNKTSTWLVNGQKATAIYQPRKVMDCHSRQRGLAMTESVPERSGLFDGWYYRPDGAASTKPSVFGLLVAQICLE